MDMEKEKLNPQAEKIYQILLDGAWHCPIDWRFSDGHGKRLTDIKRYLETKGQTLAWDWCDCGRHTAKIKKRKIVLHYEKSKAQETWEKTTDWYESAIKSKADVEKWNAQFYPKVKQPLKILFGKLNDKNSLDNL